MRYIVIIVPFMVLTMLFSLPTFSLPSFRVKTTQTGSSVQLHEIIGQEQSKHVYLENDQLSIIYSSFQKADQMLLVFNGSGYNNQSVDMTYLRFQDNKYLYSSNIVLTSYTTFYGYANISGTTEMEYFTPTTDVKIKAHRLWTTKDRPPYLLDVKGSQFESNNLDPAVSTYIVDNSSSTLIRYLSLTKSPSIVTLVYGFQGKTQEMVYSIEMTRDVNNTNEYTAYLPHFNREIWFTTFSDVSYEVNQNEVRQFSYHRITNGIKILNMEYFGKTNNIVSPDITDHSTIYANITTVNETSHEFLSLKIYVNYTKVTDHFPILNRTITINSTFYTIYEIELGMFRTDSTIQIDVNMLDTDTSQLVGYFNSSNLVVGKYGPSLSFDKIVKVSSTQFVSINFIIYDNDKGISSIKLTTNSSTYELNRNERSAEISLIPGYNLITLNVSNLDNETTTISSTLLYDNSKPNIGNILVEPVYGNFSLQTNVYDNSSVDSGLLYYTINVNNVTILRNFDSTVPNATIYENFKPKIGDNMVNLTVYDVAGNYISKIRKFTFTISETQETPFPLIFVALPILIVPITRKFLER